MPPSLPRKDDVPTILARMMQGAGVSTQTELASLLEIGKAAISDAKRRNIVPAEWYLKLCRAPYYLNPLWLESGVGEKHLEYGGPSGVEDPWPGYGESVPDGAAEHHECVLVPLALPRLSAAGALETAQAEGPFRFDGGWLAARGAPAAMKLLPVTGEAMLPTLKEKDHVLVDESQRDFLEGALYVLRMDTRVVLKRLDMRPGVLVLVSENRELYPPIEVPLPCDDVEILGRVVWLCRDL